MNSKNPFKESEANQEPEQDSNNAWLVLVFNATLLIAASLISKWQILTDSQIQGQIIGILGSGFLIDLFIATGLLVIASTFTQFWVMALCLASLGGIQLLVFLDIFHIYRFHCRINTAFFSHAFTTKMVALPAIIAGVIFIMAISFFHLRKKKQMTVLKTHRISLLTIAFLLLLAQPIAKNFFKPDFDSKTWDEYFSAQEFLAAYAPEKTSLGCAFLLKPDSLYIDELDAFKASPYAKRFLRDFDAQKKPWKQYKHPNAEKVWSHRGVHDSKIENSVESILAAIENGFSGIELDVNFAREINQLIVTHDRYDPNKIFSYVPLEEILSKANIASMSEKPFFWIDFKNLTPYNRESAGKILLQIANKFDLKDKLMIESSYPFLLRGLSKAGLRTIWALSYGNPDLKISQESLDLAKSLLVLGQFDMLSVPWQTSQQKIILESLDFPLAVYTVNDRETIIQLASQEKIKVILTDLSTPSDEKNK